MKKSWLEELDTPVIQLAAITSAKPVRGHGRVRRTGRCFGTRKNHQWINGRCFWCDKPRNER